MHKQTFRSKVDWWVWGFIISMSGLLLQLLLNMLAKGSLLQNGVFATVYALAMVLLWWPIWSTRYQLSEGELQVKCMFLTWRIPLAQIQSVQETDFSAVAPALSFQRLRVNYVQSEQTKFILLSPRNIEAFQASVQAQRAHERN